MAINKFEAFYLPLAMRGGILRQLSTALMTVSDANWRGTAGCDE
jgi:hypothetical protein